MTSKPQMRVTNIALDYDEMPMTINFVMTAEIAERIGQHVPEFAVPTGSGEVTATMPVGLAARTCKTFGAMRSPDGVTHEIYSCLTGALFNRFYDGGVDDYLAEHQ